MVNTKEIPGVMPAKLGLRLGPSPAPRLTRSVQEWLGDMRTGLVDPAFASSVSSKVAAWNA